MSSYVAVVGKPVGESVCIFGLTPQEVRYLQSKFPNSMKHDSEWNPSHGIRLECACIVILNALGYIGFKVIGTSGDNKEYLWTMERNLDMDTQYQNTTTTNPILTMNIRLSTTQDTTHQRLWLNFKHRANHRWHPQRKMKEDTVLVENWPLLYTCDQNQNLIQAVLSMKFSNFFWTTVCLFSF